MPGPGVLPYNHKMIVLFLTLAASLAALIGGFVAIKNRNKLPAAMALTSGLVLGLVVFGLLPEIFDLAVKNGLDPVWPMALFVGGFLLFHAIEKYILLHLADEKQYGPHRHPLLGEVRAGAIIGHSFLDGLSIGVGFQVSPSVGAAIALAVIGHRFADGFDTTNYMLFHKNRLPRIKKLLAAVIVFPILGGLSSFVVALPQSVLAVYLGFFAGVLMYIASGSIMPQAHTKKASAFNLSLTIIGVALMLVLTRLV